eukprot:gnl/TRDRNA2_/TRDRNA2_34407_c0_seq1.p2 gnl/TRDRNA2_/TRDRNA2_34407_c0~~gnl/TRDRNA2_/TRDRNA2_34407_c0_seq1.p2  ORF type:complete len:176 (+),score=60.33 gnl/TRDRNA2_/TRDRNA2_34407_c0_seq1:469-996(+)
MARELSKPPCDIKTYKYCNEKQRKFIAMMRKMSEEEIDNMTNGWTESYMNLIRVFHLHKEEYEHRVMEAKQATMPVRIAEQNMSLHSEQVNWKRKLVEKKRGAQEPTIAEKIAMRKAEEENARVQYADFQAKRQAAREEQEQRMQEEMEEKRARMLKELEEEIKKQKAQGENAEL